MCFLSLSGFFISFVLVSMLFGMCVWMNFFILWALVFGMCISRAPGTLLGRSNIWHLQNPSFFRASSSCIRVMAYAPLVFL